MRLKQLLGIILVAVATASAAGAASQLAGVQVEKRDQASVLTIRANGPFTHTEYRPTDNLMLVDLAGVDVAQQDGNIHSVSGADLQSYRVVGYRSPAGAEVARIELKLASGATANVSEIKDGVEVRVSGSSAGPNTASAENVKAAPARTAESAHISRISNIAVTRGKDGINIEVTGNTSIVAKTMKLTHPDRIVVDIPNSVLQGRSREIPVNSSDVKEVRAAHYQTEPPTTRIVVDLTVMREFELIPAGNKLMLKVKNADVAPQSLPAAKEVVAQQSQTDSSPTATRIDAAVPPANQRATEKPAETAQLTNAAPQPVTESKEKKQTSAVQARSEEAAAHFVKPVPSPVFTPNQPVPAGSSSLAAGPAVINAALQQQQERAAAANPTATSCTSGHYTGAPLNLDLKDLDIKDFFRLIHEISGLNVVLDPSVKGIVTIDVTDIPWDQALAIVLRNNALECELEGNVLRIATLDTLRAEADSRRAQQEAIALQVPRQSYTRYLSYAHAKDTVPILKKFLSARGDVVADDRSNAIIIEDIPASLPKVDELLTRLDRKSPEVEIEARVVAATRNFARDIGTQLGFGWGNGKSTATGGGTTTASPIAIAPPGGITPPWITVPGDSTRIPLFSNLPATGPTSGISLTNFSSMYRIDFALTMAENRGLVKILSRPRVITQNNIQALVRQGSRIPVVTQAQLGGPPTVTYVDSFLRLQVTPQITNENTIFLQVDVENTTPDFSRVNGAQLNPTLNTQQTTTQVLVSDGQTVVIGGVIQTQNSVAIAQVPVLGNIPLLGNLFKHTSINTQTQELIFFITPKIIQT
jgi:type IV pilus assembly protein PilQ